MMHGRGHMSPWAEQALAAATGSWDAERIVRASRLTGLVGRSPNGPWVAKAPDGVRVTGWDIVAVVNEAAGELIVKGGDDVR